MKSCSFATIDELGSSGISGRCDPQIASYLSTGPVEQRSYALSPVKGIINMWNFASSGRSSLRGTAELEEEEGMTKGKGGEKRRDGMVH
jgi:hypothetical protein